MDTPVEERATLAQELLKAAKKGEMFEWLKSVRKKNSWALLEIQEEEENREVQLNTIPFPLLCYPKA